MRRFKPWHVRYVYSWDKAGGVNIVKIHDKAGALVSETRIGASVIEQTTPGGKTTFFHKPK